MQKQEAAYGSFLFYQGKMEQIVKDDVFPSKGIHQGGWILSPTIL